MTRKLVSKTCEYCGKIFVGETQRRFCSLQCGGKGRFKPKEVPKRCRGEIKLCLICGKQFYAKRTGGQKFCSFKCKGIASRNKQRSCEVCGIAFQPVANNKRFCSWKCKYKARQNGRSVSCETCGKMIYLPLARLTKTKHHFCSKEHANLWQGKNKVHFTCKICGCDFSWSPSRTKTSNIQYCSIKCRNADPERKRMLLQMNTMQQTQSPTKIENIGYQMLASLQIPFETQKLINDKMTVDAYLPQCNLIIQFDGDYWHGNPQMFQTFDHRQIKRMNLDKSQDAYLRVCGYHILRFWESDIYNRLNWVKDIIQNQLVELQVGSVSQ